MPISPESSNSQTLQEKTPPRKHWLLRAFLWLFGLCAAGAVAAAMVAAIALAMAYPNLPDVSELADYRPKLPLRVYSAEGALLGEFGEERRTLTPIQDIPKVMVDAVLAIEDTRFFEHGGVDYIGMLRAALANLGKVKSQGASTITMQVARNVYLSSEKTYTRKIYEILLTFKLEHLLSKEKILEIYMNQIFGSSRLRLCCCQRSLFRQTAQGHHHCGSRHAGRTAQSPISLQPHQQPQTRPHPPALHH